MGADHFYNGGSHLLLNLVMLLCYRKIFTSDNIYLVEVKTEVIS